LYSSWDLSGDRPAKGPSRAPDSFCALSCPMPDDLSDGNVARASRLRNAPGFTNVRRPPATPDPPPRSGRGGTFALHRGSGHRRASRLEFTAPWAIGPAPSPNSAEPGAVRRWRVHAARSSRARARGAGDRFSRSCGTEPHGPGRTAPGPRSLGMYIMSGQARCPRLVRRSRCWMSLRHVRARRALRAESHAAR
jgi:hypothetical protein